MTTAPLELQTADGTKAAGKRAKRRLLEVLAILLFLLFMVPFLLVVLNAAKTSKEIMLSPISWPENWGLIGQNILSVVNNPSTDYVGAFIDSVIVTVGAEAIILLCSAMCAWVLVRNKTRWATIIFMCFVAAMVIPFQVVMFPLVRFLKSFGDFLGITLMGTYQGIYFAYLGFGSSMSIFILHGFIKGVPLELEEAATIDGCSQVGTFFRIVVPLLQPVCVTVLILNGIWIWNDYLLPLLVLGTNGEVQTLPLAVTAFVGSYVKQWDLILTSAMLAMLPIIVIFIFLQRYIIKGMVEGSIK